MEVGDITNIGELAAVKKSATVSSAEHTVYTEMLFIIVILKTASLRTECRDRRNGKATQPDLPWQRYTTHDNNLCKLK